jgi:1-aminocyclopropane-1-carboxylate deaminase/D-cysteine desulfhydrase-like pyridoxal-dependent ACC family enzyme
MKPPVDTSVETLTPIACAGGIWIKRDDSFNVYGVNGGKVRSCLILAQNSTGLVTAASRSSPQGHIVAAIARGLRVACRIHTASGARTPEMERALESGAKIIQHRAGYSSVVQARAREDAAARAWTLIPFGMESQVSIDLTARQMINIPGATKRLVVPVGSGMTLAGILWGLKSLRRKLPVVGVLVGADPTRRLDRWAPSDWRKKVKFCDSRGDYAKPAAQLSWSGIPLDPLYEAKCIPFLQRADCLWIVGHRGDSVSGDPELKTPSD